MISFKAILQKFDKKGEKTGWTYLEIPPDLAEQLKPDTRTGYRVKGRLDDFLIKLVAILPMGDGSFIMPINAEMRRGLRKKEGTMVHVELSEDTDPLPQSDDLWACLADDPKALAKFESLPKSHQNYYSKWIESAKTIETKSRRIAMTVKGLAMNMDYGEMMRYYKSLKS